MLSHWAPFSSTSKLRRFTLTLSSTCAPQLTSLLFNQIADFPKRRCNSGTSIVLSKSNCYEGNSIGRSLRLDKNLNGNHGSITNNGGVSFFRTIDRFGNTRGRTGHNPNRGLRCLGISGTNFSNTRSDDSVEDSNVSDEVSVVADISQEEQVRILKEDKVAPATGRPLADIAAEIWDHKLSPVGPGHRSGLEILQQPLKGPLYTSWYPIPASKNPHNPFKLTDKQERWKNKLKILRASGKGPPKKGAGKRSK